MKSRTGRTLGVRWLGWALVLLGVTLFVVWAGRLARTGLALREHVAHAQGMVGATGSTDPVEACRLMTDLRGDVRELRDQTAFVPYVAPVLRWLPGVGDDLEAAPHLLVVADSVTEAGTVACDALEPVLSAFEATGEGTEVLSPEGMVQLLDQERGSLESALASVERAQDAWAKVDPENLSPALADWAELLDQGLPLVQAGLEVAVVAPDLMGLEQPRTYLILAQNEDELRPTGGFISGVGVLTLEEGRIAGLSFSDAYTVDDYEHRPYPEPPMPLLTYMGSELWLFRDSNWSPDFPTSARQAAFSYEYGQGVSVDGVIALDQRVVELLVTGVGEVQIPGLEQPVTADRVREFMRAAWAPGDSGATLEWMSNRKEFMGQLAAAILQRIEDEPDSVDWMQVGKALYQALEGRHLLLYVDHAQVANVLLRLGWDGALRESDGDYLMIVDANLGFSKVNPLVSQQAVVHVALDTEGAATTELTVRYVHQGEKEGVRCEHLPSYHGELSYEALMHRCYYDYLRVYVPAGSALRAATPHPIPGEYLILGQPADGQAVVLPDEAGKTVFGQFFVVEYGQTLETRLEYEVPRVTEEDEGRWHYSLLIQKQPGADELPISLTIVLPPGASLLAATPSPRTIDEDTLAFDLILDSDIVVEVDYTLK